MQKTQKTPHPVRGFHPIMNADPSKLEVVPSRFIGGLLKKAVDYFFPKLQKSVRKFIEAHKDEKLESFVVYRAPLDKISNNFLNVLTLGDWDEIKKRGGVDKVFHTYAIINGKYIYEKLANPSFRMASQADLNRDGAESVSVQPRNITIGSFIANAIKVMGDKFYSYDAFTNNCQDFPLASLRGSMMSTPQAVSFLKQDVKKLIEETPSLSKYLGREATDLAGAGERIYSEIVDKKGGMRKKKFLG